MYSVLCIEAFHCNVSIGKSLIIVVAYCKIRSTNYRIAKRCMMIVTSSAKFRVFCLKFNHYLHIICLCLVIVSLLKRLVPETKCIDHENIQAPPQVNVGVDTAKCVRRYALS